MTSSRRLERVNELVLRSLATILAQKVSDPRIKGVSLVKTDVSSDFALARITYSFLEGQTTREKAQQGLDSAKPFLRRELKKVIDLRIIPELAFFYDESIQHGDKILELINSIHKKPE